MLNEGEGVYSFEVSAVIAAGESGVTSKQAGKAESFLSQNLSSKQEMFQLYRSCRAQMCQPW